MPGRLSYYLPHKHACDDRLVCTDSVEVLARGCKKRGYARGFGVGIAGGYATIGTIGFEDRLEYGAMGTVTNIAVRLSGEAKDGQIFISPRIFSKVEPYIEAEAVGELSLKGFHRPVSSHNVLAIRREASE